MLSSNSLIITLVNPANENPFRGFYDLTFDFFFCHPSAPLCYRYEVCVAPAMLHLVLINLIGPSLMLRAPNIFFCVVFVENLSLKIFLAALCDAN